MISDQITQLIEQAKDHPNGESRNSMISRLKDARAHAFVMEREEFMKNGNTANTDVSVPIHAFADFGNGDPCICPAPDARSKSCTATVHK